jgi:uncharacterized protein
MPKVKAPVRKARKTPVKKKIRKRQNRPRLGLYFLAAIFTVFIMWVLIREPQVAPLDLEIPTEESRQTVSSKKAQNPARKEAVADAAQPSTSISELTPVPKPLSPQNPRKGETALDMAIRKAAISLGVPENAVRRRKSEDLIRYSVPLDRSQMDLTYGNMVFKGNLELAGASFEQGEDSRNKQTLSFRHKDFPERYQIELFYDSKHYKDRIPGKKITIVIDDFGAISGSLLDGFFALDPSVCFAIFPEEAHSVQTMHRATAQGRETIIHVPMEPIGYPSVNPGKNPILLQHTENQIDRMLSSFIADLPDAIGINNHMGSLATTDPDVMQAVMNTLRKHDKAFLDSRTTNVSVGYQTAQKTHIRAFRNDIFLDSPNISQSTMDAKFNQIIQMSGSKNHIIAITHCHNKEKLDYLKSFISRLKKAGFTLVPLSEYGSHEVPEIL